jgi:hypothetical protein
MGIFGADEIIVIHIEAVLFPGAGLGDHVVQKQVAG